MSFKPMVRVTGEQKFSGNGLRFATREEAESNVHDLMMRWFLVEETTVEESADPVNYTYVDHKLVPVTETEAADVKTNIAD
jgi:hypothetical protein